MRSAALSGPEAHLSVLTALLASPPRQEIRPPPGKPLARLLARGIPRHGMNGQRWRAILRRPVSLAGLPVADLCGGGGGGEEEPIPNLNALVWRSLFLRACFQGQLGRDSMKESYNKGIAVFLRETCWIGQVVDKSSSYFNTCSERILATGFKVASVWGV